MSERLQKYFADILASIENINIHLGNKLDYRLFSENITVRSAVEREMLVIGEATNRILKIDSQISISNAKKIVQLRNKMIHEYDVIDDTQIWNIIVNHLPKLKIEIEMLLDKM